MTVTAHDIRDAAKRLEGHVVATPLVDAPMLSATLGCDVRLKLENLQHTSSFKARGAFIAMQALADDARQRGVITMSAGNHARRCLSCPPDGHSAVIVMPAQTPFAKVSRTRAHGAEVVLQAGTSMNARNLSASSSRNAACR